MTKPLPATVRDAWQGYVDADDYDAHMARNGQAEANARLVALLLERYPPSGDRLLVAGAGTGQWLDFDLDALSGRHITCSDINPGFLARLSARAARAGREVETVVDDLERSRLAPVFDAAIVVLVLEHIDWRRGVESLVRLGIERCFIVTQENPPRQESVLTPGREPIGTIRAFLSVHPQLVDREELGEAFRARGYTCLGRQSVDVPDGKRMYGTVFGRLR
jgi:Methyltransferase domain